MSFIKNIKSVFIDFKIFLKLRFVYPDKTNFERIKSIVPSNIKVVESNVVIEENVDLGAHLTSLPLGLYVGKNSYLGYCSKIGKFTSISFDVKIGLVAHPLNFVSTSPLLYSKRRGWVTENLYDDLQAGFVEIGNDVLISANVIVLAGVKIGDGAVIGAGSFVNKDVPPYCIVGGVPAKVIKKRFPDDIINDLLEKKWWNLSKEDLLSQKHNFNNPEQFLKQHTNSK